MTPDRGATAIAEQAARSGYIGLVLDRLADQAARILDADDSRIYVRDPSDPGTTILAAARGPAEPCVGDRAPRAEERARLRAPAATLNPDRCGGGVLQVRSDTADAFSAADLGLLETLADIAATAVERDVDAHARADEMRHRIGDLIARLAERDAYTAEHSHSVVTSACAVGRRLGCSEAELIELALAALLHDVGKVRVQDSLLRKPGPLTPLEHATLRCHPTWSASLLARVPGLQVVAAIARYHHERWDGTGYPDGLAGERIPLASRIIAVCDAYDAMTSTRPYRAALSPREAEAELRAGAGTQFDPAVVDAFLETRRD